MRGLQGLERLNSDFVPMFISIRPAKEAGKESGRLACGKMRQVHRASKASSDSKVPPQCPMPYAKLHGVD